MERITFLLLLLFASFLTSSGKTIHPLRQGEAKRKIETEKVDFESYIYSKRREVRPIEPGYRGQYFKRKNGKEESATGPKEKRRCFCGIPQGFSCPDGFLTTQIHWNDAPLAGSPVPPNLPAEGPPFDVGDEWAWLQDAYDGYLQHDVYGWSWKERLNDNVQVGPQLGASPRMQQGWCCKFKKDNFERPETTSWLSEFSVLRLAPTLDIVWVMTKG